VLGVLVGVYAVLFITARTPSADGGGGFAPVVGLHVSVMVLALAAIAYLVMYARRDAQGRPR
jgi:hypothetical protein